MQRLRRAGTGQWLSASAIVLGLALTCFALAYAMAQTGDDAWSRRTNVMAWAFPASAIALFVVALVTLAVPDEVERNRAKRNRLGEFMSQGQAMLNKNSRYRAGDDYVAELDAWANPVADYIEKEISAADRALFLNSAGLLSMTGSNETNWLEHRLQRLGEIMSALGKPAR